MGEGKVDLSLRWYGGWLRLYTVFPLIGQTKGRLHNLKITYKYLRDIAITSMIRLRMSAKDAHYG
ncbi:MAG: hypothetical protein IKU98_08635, partial [Bacteroidaceae bacterium]|nr:hypothetical protein [Bacteroidaceae bacterium]